MPTRPSLPLLATIGAALVAALDVLPSCSSCRYS